METPKFSDEFLDNMIKNTVPPTQEEIDARPEISENNPLMDGDRDKELHAREDSLEKTKETEETHES